MKDISNVSGTMKQIMSFKPSTLETIDYAVHDFVDKTLDIFCTTNKGFKKVPVIWQATERAFQIKNNKDLRDDNGTLIFPMISITRTGFEKSLTDKGVFFGNVPPVNDPKGGSITIARQIEQDKTGNFLNADTYRKKNNIVGNQGSPGSQQINFPDRRKIKEKKIVYETITIPMPSYVSVMYDVKIRSEYQQQVNEIVQPFVTVTNGINYLVFKRDGHSYEAFVQSDFSSTNDLTELGAETRIYETNITIKVLGYLVGGDKNSKQPNIVRRENAVNVKIPRERVIVGDDPDWVKGKYRP
tara:strand:+ start:4061 stop:4957 length:897 start_codon:yes stop_codon:yes gene_type:complete